MIVLSPNPNLYVTAVGIFFNDSMQSYYIKKIFDIRVYD